jgi:hypothetical protein
MPNRSQNPGVAEAACGEHEPAALTAVTTAPNVPGWRPIAAGWAHGLAGSCRGRGQPGWWSRTN